MNVQEFAAKYVNGEDCDWGECYPEADEFVLVYSEDECEHKTCWVTNVYKMGDDYFEVTWTRDNSGYWSDGERYPGETRQVKPVTKTIVQTTYEAV